MVACFNKIGKCNRKFVVNCTKEIRMSYTTKIILCAGFVLSVVAYPMAKLVRLASEIVQVV